MSNVLAVDIGSSHFRVGVFGQDERCLKVTEDDTPVGQHRELLLEQVRARCAAAIQESTEPVVACGVSFGGLVDFQRQLATSLRQLGWDRFPLADWLQQTLGLPCRIDGDANAGALGEFRYGAGKGTDSFVFVMLSTWLRCSLVCQGELWRGKDSLAGELGHVPVSESGTVCSCGAKGCLELFCSGAAIANEGREFARRRPEAMTPVVERCGGSIDGITARAVAEAAAEGDAVASHIMGEAARWLARALTTVIHIVNPDKVVLGGGVAQAGPVLWDPLREALQARASPTVHPTTEIVPAELGTRSSLYGAAALALELSSEGPLLLLSNSIWKSF